MSRTVPLILISLVNVAAALAVDTADNPHVWNPKVKSVAVFKNGLGFFMREGPVTLRDGWCVAKAVPPAAFGTLAIYSHGKKEAVDVVGSGPGEMVAFDGIDAPNDVATKRGRLKTCRNLKVQLTYTYKDTDRVAAGKLAAVGTEYAVLETDNNSFAVPVADITKLQILELPLRVHVSSDKGGSPAESNLGMAYLRKGLTWIPEYTLQILDEDTAELTLRGTLVNEAEDLVHCDVNFVVGVPHFMHTQYMAPIAVGQVIRTIGAQVAPPVVMSQIANRAMIANDTRADQFLVVEQPIPDGGADIKKALGNLPQMEGPGGADYTVYTKKDLTVRRGEKAIVTLFVKKIRYGHVYRWAPPASLSHLLVLQNNTGTAWTTGPCLTINAGSPLSEDLLKYVPKGGRGELPVTTAINVAHQKSETEVSRKLKAHTPSSHFYVDLVNLQGQLKVRNYEKTAVDIIVDADIPGKPLSASDEGSISVDTTKLKLMERSGKIHWQFKLKPADEKTLTYTYERYVPSK